tara:strand:- start:8305 stop:8946 length:642 start_codon:yes stop_codon:yes gene_type:complete
MLNNANISIKLLDTDVAIRKKIYESIAEQLNKSISKNKAKATTLLKSKVSKWVSRQPEIRSLRSNGGIGSLAAHFGLTPTQADIATESIISAVVDSLQVKIKPINRRLKGTIEFNFQETNFLNLLSINSGHVVTEKGADLHWLDWLITRGDTIIITGYSYIGGPTGRSGGGEMNIGGAWRVPPEFSGTPTNNFITRAFEGTQKEIEEVLKRLI